MADHIRIRKAGGVWTVRSGGAVLAESNAVLELNEGDLEPVIYFPRADVAMAFLDRSDKTSHCPHKGDANYFHIINRSATVRNGAWTYENPIDGVTEIKDYLAFYNSDDVTVEQI